MRADRLLTLLMLLQDRGRLTAAQLAAELEVSIRTIYRDIEALSFAGVPVYAERGPGGGVELLEGYRTRLTGLSPAEIQALFMVSIPEPLNALGIGQDFKSALLKLTAALPESGQDNRHFSRERIHLDSRAWMPAEEPAPRLRALQQAVWMERRVSILQRTLRDTQVEKLLEPYGLVAKTNVWYLVGAMDGRWQVIRAAQIIEVEVLPETFERRPDFDLAAFWEDWCQRYFRLQALYPVQVRAAPALLPQLRTHFGDAVLADQGQVDGDGWLTLTLPFQHIFEARDRLLGYGSAVEVLSPEALRLTLVDVARQVVNFYDRKSQRGTTA
jgi:predicted DNA-binding transcriptional regulator YafY